MHFDPQSNYASEPETLQVPPIVARPPALGTRSPLKTAVAIVVIGFVAGLGMWLWSEGVPGRQNAAADTTAGSGIADSIVQYAEAIINEKTEADSVTAAADKSIESRLSRGGRRYGSLTSQDEFRSGKLAMGMGDHKQAVVHFTAATKIDPEYADAHYRLGLAYVRLGNFTAARREQGFLMQLGDDRANLLGHLVDN